jgi:hypothetical protein
MSRSHFSAVAVALALGAFAPRLMAQDTSSTTPTRSDTSGYTTGAGGVDTSARPGRVGATDTAVGGAGDSSAFTRLPGADTSSGAGGAVTDTMPPAGDTSGMQGRHPADSTRPGSTTSPGTESNGSAESGGDTKPS